MSIRRALCSTLERFDNSLSSHFECNDYLPNSDFCYTQTIIPPALLSAIAEQIDFICLCKLVLFCTILFV